MRNAESIQRELLGWWGDNKRNYPWRSRIPMWRGLLVEVLLQRTRADQVAPVFKSLKTRYPRAVDLLNMTQEDAGELFGSLGLFWRAPLFVELAHELGRRRGRLKREDEELLNLPGVGPYAAAAALSLHGGVRRPIVDSNTTRIVSRIQGRTYDQETRRKKWVHKNLEQLTPEVEHREFNLALLDFGAIICRPKSPNCVECPISIWCKTGNALSG